jgi:hypothetical protein
MSGVSLGRAALVPPPLQAGQPRIIDRSSAGLSQCQGLTPTVEWHLGKDALPHRVSFLALCRIAIAATRHLVLAVSSMVPFGEDVAVPVTLRLRLSMITWVNADAGESADKSLLQRAMPGRGVLHVVAT